MTHFLTGLLDNAFVNLTIELKKKHLGRRLKEALNLISVLSAFGDGQSACDSRPFEKEGASSRLP